MNKILMWVLIGLGVVGLAFAGFVVYEMSQPQLVKKPAIYMYPAMDSFVDVRLEINGKMIKDMPEYGKGWHVFVTKEGFIDGKYDYLFYEAKLKTLDVPEEGWVVRYENLDSWLDITLGKLGLNEKEAFQFKEYWLEELPRSEYYEVHLLSQDFLDENMRLIISPEPDTIIRLNFYFKPLEEKMDIVEPEIKTPLRKGFTVVEWGGILDNQP